MQELNRDQKLRTLAPTGHLSRRQLLQIGGLSMLGLGLPELLSLRQQAVAHERAGAAEKSCIFIVQYGGASHIDTLDPKPTAPAEVRGAYQPITTQVPGMLISSMLPRLAGLAKHFCLVRSLTHATADHDAGMHVCMTGHSRPEANTPYLGAVVAKLKPTSRPVPSYVWLLNLFSDVAPRYQTGGILGASCAPLLVGKDEDNPAAPNFHMGAFDLPAEATFDRLRGRARLLEGQTLSGNTASQSAATQAMRSYQRQAYQLVSSSQARKAFELHNEPMPVRDRYGRHPIGQNLLLARRLVEAGVRLITVNAWCGRACAEDFLATEGWDHHGVAGQVGGIFGNRSYGLGFMLPRFDQAVSALLDDLHQRGLLETTLVVVVGEFGRTPKVANNPFPGRDHWPHCYSALLAGGGVRGGCVVGASDKIGAFVARQPVSPQDFHATIYSSLGIPPHTRYGPDGFSLRASEGEPIPGLVKGGA
jgi:uncharacterized protein (DUF1501 family)